MVMMRPDILRSKLQGAIAFPVTPFREDMSLDLDGLRKNLRVILAHPMAAIVAAGGTGELYSLTPAEHVDVVRTVVDETAGRVPVIAGAGYNTAIGAQLASQAAEAGASGVLAFPPYYPGAEDDGLFDYYRAIADATPLGMLIYSRDWFHPGVGLVERLAGLPTLVAWKDGQGDIRRLQILKSAVGDRLCWIGGAGDDLVPAYYSLGIRAFTSSIANVSPSMAVALHNAASTNDTRTLQQLMDRYVVPLYALRGKRRGYEVTVMKEIMTVLGLTGGAVRPPLARLRQEDMSEVRRLAAAFSATAVEPISSGQQP
jgi:5-dehydro-4-deoxyglucarate dehydratase